MLKILFVTGGSPWPTTMGVNQRTNLLHKALSECGQVDLIINSQYVILNERETEFLKEKYRLQTLVNPLNKDGKHSAYRDIRMSRIFNKKLQDWFGQYLTNGANENYIREKILAEKYNVIVARYLRSAVNTGLIKFAPIVLDVDDLSMDAVIKRINSKNKNYNTYKQTALRIYGRLLSVIEQRLFFKFDFLWFTKDVDKNFVKNKRSAILPNIPFIDNAIETSGNTDLQKDNVALFIGSMRHTVNVEGIDRFINKAWPKIRSLKENAVLRVIGTGMTEKQKKDWNRVEGVQAVGFVENIGLEYNQCAFSIIPLYEGGGTKIKLIESLRYGRTCVVTTHSMRGYESVLKNNIDISVASNNYEFAEKCLELYNNREKRIAMGLSGKLKIEQYFTYSAFKKVVEETVFKVASTRTLVRLKSIF